MPRTFELNGQWVTLDDNEMRMVTRRLISQTRVHMWNNVSGPFTHSYRGWQWHHNQRNHPIHWIFEAAGAANLPSASWANRLKTRHAQLDKSLKPAKIQYFFDNLAGWQRESALFRREMRNYLNSFDGGGGSAVRVTTIIRDSSFTLLQVLAAMPTGGASVAAAVTARSAATAFVRGAATNFVIREIDSASRRVGRLIAGETVTIEESLRTTGQNALRAVSNQALGGILDRFIGPLKGVLSTAVQRELRSGRLLRGVAIEFTSSQIQSAISDAITDLLPIELQSALRDVPESRSERESAQSTARHLMDNRNFRRRLERNLNLRGAR